jgi:carboxyl-terminal processing protease
MMWRKQAGGDLYVAQVIADGPAARASIRRGQIIRAINGTPAAMLTLEDAAKLARGTAGTTVQLDVSEPDSIEWRRVSLIRQAIVVGVDYRMLDYSVGLLSVTSFNEQTPARVKQALEVLAAQGARGLVLDLRNSERVEGGSTQSDVAGYFVGNTAPLWLERNKGEAKATPMRSSQAQVWQKPVVALVNQNTFGSSVLLAAALRYAGHVRLIGRSTAAAPAADLFETQPDGSARRAAVRLFFTMRDEPLSSRGLAPDVPLDRTMSSADELARGVAALVALLPPASAPDR